MKNIKTAFADAVAKYPERERRVALATFIARYSQDWPVTDYRCVGLDAGVIKTFLDGCGLRPDVDYKDVVSSLDPEAHQLKWVNKKPIINLAAALSSMLPSEAGRTRLYVAQIENDQPDPAPGLADVPDDETASSECGPRFWDPLKLYDHTMALARAAELLEGRPKQWARAWFAKSEENREIMAPLWVIEACTPEEKRLGLFTPTSRSPEGSTASIPFVLGRYTRRDENLSPAFPMLASEPVATLWGREPLHTRVCPLEGYVSVTVADLMSIPKTDPLRDTWTQVESAYVATDSITTLDQVAALVRPERLWRYIAELYEAAYGRRVALMSDLCRVHSGTVRHESDNSSPVSALDQLVKDGGAKMEIRPAFVMVNEPPKSEPGTSHGEARVAAGSPNFVSLPGDENVPPDEIDLNDYYVDDVKNMASEWYLMTHCSTDSFTRPYLPVRPTGGDIRILDTFRHWASATPEAVARPADALVPRDVQVDLDYYNGYNAVKHVAYSLIKYFATSLDAPTWNHAFCNSGTDGWNATHPAVHADLAPVMAIWSGVLGDGSPVPCLLRSSPSPSDVTDALSVLARPDVQLAMPAKPKEVQIVVETSLCFSTLKASTDLGDSAKHACREAFLWGFQANQARHRSYTLQACHYSSPAHAAMLDELKKLDVRSWSALWGNPNGLDCGYDDHVGSNKSDLRVYLMPDKFDRLVLVFGLSAGSPADNICRAAFRYFTGLPMVPATSMRTVLKERRSRWVVVDPQADPSSAFRQILEAHLRDPGSSVVAGWTDWRSEWARENPSIHIVPERSDYRSVPLSMPTPHAVAAAAAPQGA